MVNGLQSNARSPVLRAPGSPDAQDSGGARAEIAPENDARCIAAILSGERERFGELIDRYQRAVVAVVRGYIADPHLAEDTAQEIFIKAYTSLNELRDRRLFLPWLLQIARHHAGKSGRKFDSGLPTTSELDSRPAPDETPPDNRLHSALAAVEQLAEPYRETILLKYEANLSCKQIAQQQGVSVGTVTSRLTRALIMLRNALK